MTISEMPQHAYEADMLDTPVSEAGERHFVMGRNDTPPSTEELMQKARDTPIVQHGDTFNVLCPECPQVMRSTSLLQHMRKFHGMTGKMPRGWLNEHRTDLPPSKTRPRVGKASAKRPPKVVAKPKALPPLDTEALTTMVLAALFPKGIPVDMLRPTMRWMEATDRFVQEAKL